MLSEFPCAETPGGQNVRARAREAQAGLSIRLGLEPPVETVGRDALKPLF